jgi:HEAT repeat protein
MNQTRALRAILVLLLPVWSGAQTSAPRQAPNRETAGAQIDAAIQQQKYDRALAAYDTYILGTGQPDAALLAQIAKADLHRIVRRDMPPGTLAGNALERLARAGETEALQALKRQATEAAPMSPEQLTLTASLARLADQAALDRLGKLLDGIEADRKGEVIRVIQDVGSRSLAVRIAQYLAAPQPQVRCAAALAVGVLQYVDAIPTLQQLFKSDVGIVRLFAATALKRLGQTSADAYLMDILRTGAPEVRLIAAEGYQSSPTNQWVAYVSDLLSDRNEINRLRAAEVIACCDESRARGPLMTALDSDNPSLRGEAARILETKNLADLRVARRLLGDPADAVRVYGAGAALHAATSPRR